MRNYRLFDENIRNYSRKMPTFAFIGEKSVKPDVCQIVWIRGKYFIWIISKIDMEFSQKSRFSDLFLEIAYNIDIKYMPR